MMLASSLLVVCLLVLTNGSEFKKEDMEKYEAMHKNCFKDEVKEHIEACLPEEAKKMTEEQRKEAAKQATEEQMKEGIEKLMLCLGKNHKMINENNEVVNAEHCNYLKQYAVEGKAAELVKASEGCGEIKDPKAFEKCFAPKYMEICKSA